MLVNFTDVAGRKSQGRPSRTVALAEIIVNPQLVSWFGLEEVSPKVALSNPYGGVGNFDTRQTQVLEYGYKTK